MSEETLGFIGIPLVIFVMFLAGFLAVVFILPTSIHKPSVDVVSGFVSTVVYVGDLTYNEKTITVVTFENNGTFPFVGFHDIIVQRNWSIVYESTSNRLYILHAEMLP